MNDFDKFAPLLKAVGVLHAANEVAEWEEIALHHGLSVSEMHDVLGEAQEFGLVDVIQWSDHEAPFLTQAGRQYLARRGNVELEVLQFMAGDVDDLDARDALLDAGHEIVNDFAEAAVQGMAVEYASDLVPPAFARAIDGRLAMRMYAATAGLMTRLACGGRPGCIAEEVVVVQLEAVAVENLERRTVDGRLDPVGLEGAASAVREGLRDAMGDDDVYDLWDLKEPADVAVDRLSPITQWMGKADQRLEAWFEPLYGAARTGHLDR